VRDDVAASSPPVLEIGQRSERADGEAVTDYETVSTYNNYLITCGWSRPTCANR